MTLRVQQVCANFCPNLSGLLEVKRLAYIECRDDIFLFHPVGIGIEGGAPDDRAGKKRALCSKSNFILQRCLQHPDKAIVAQKLLPLCFPLLLPHNLLLEIPEISHPLLLHLIVMCLSLTRRPAQCLKMKGVLHFVVAIAVIKLVSLFKNRNQSRVDKDHLAGQLSNGHPHLGHYLDLSTTIFTRPSLPPYSPLPDNPPSYSPTQTGKIEIRTVKNIIDCPLDLRTVDSIQKQLQL